MKPLKNCVYSILFILGSLLIICALPTEAEARIYDDTVRLHILANSDSDTDQATKLTVRDRLLEEYSARLKDCSNALDAQEKTALLLGEIENSVNFWLTELGENYGARVTLTEEWYDTRSYGDITLPAGKYVSLQVKLGGAEGKNWWCVMYPPLCLDAATDNSPADDAYLNFTDGEYRLVSHGGYGIRFRFLEVLSGIANYFSKNP